MLKKIWPFLVILVLSYFSLEPLLKPGFFTIHDIVHPQRIDQMEKAIKSWHFPPRWSPDLGYGYGWPQFSFYSPLPYFVGALINILTKEVIVSGKILFALSIILSGYFIYLLVKEILGNLPGFVSAVFYLYSPYRALDLYVRGALAELWGIMFIPIVLFFIVKTVKEKKSKWIILGGFSYAGLILSHNITALLFTIFLSLGILIYYIYLLFHKKQKYLIHNTLYIILLGLSLSCFFWLPAIFEAQYTYLNTITGGRFAYRTGFIALRQIWDFPWGYGASAGIFSGISYMVGKLHIILAGLGLILGFYFQKKHKFLLTLIIISVFCLFLSVFMTNHRSDFFWGNLTFLSFIQYPWRFLIFVLFFLSVLTGIFISILPKKINLIISAAAIFLVILSNKGYFKPKKYLNVTQQDYLAGQNLAVEGTKASEEYLPIWRPKKTVAPPQKLISLANNKWQLIKQKVGYYQFVFNLPEKEEITVNVAYFPGWQVLIDGEETKINYRKDGLIHFNLLSGKHEIIVSFTETRLRFLADSISAAALFLVMAYFLLNTSFALFVIPTKEVPFGTSAWRDLPR